MGDARFGRRAVAGGRCIYCLACCAAYVCADCCFGWGRNDEQGYRNGASPTQQGRGQNRRHEALRGHLALNKDPSEFRFYATVRPQKEVIVSDCLDCPWLREQGEGHVCAEAGRAIDHPWQGPPEWCVLRTHTQLVRFRFKSKDL